MDTIINENRNYWTHRAPSYAKLNREELFSAQRDAWRDTLSSAINSCYPDRAPSEISVLEIGTGPGFLAIVLAECGYSVTAVDLTPAMLTEAAENAAMAGLPEGAIDFIEMNAEALSFPDASFDAVVSRNLTWNLPHPETAYREWLRVLRRGGLLLNFDANWYGYLYDENARRGYEHDREASREAGIFDRNIGENFDVMEDIAMRVPLSQIHRPKWDMDVLSSLGTRCTSDTTAYMRLWSDEERLNLASTPIFMVAGRK